MVLIHGIHLSREREDYTWMHSKSVPFASQGQGVFKSDFSSRVCKKKARKASLHHTKEGYCRAFATASDIVAS